MIKKILVPTDYSPASLNALDTAIEIARANNAVLQILQITETNINPIFTRRSSFRKNSQLICDAMAGSIFQKHGVTSEIIFAEGVPGPVIARAAYEKKPDLIVMGAHGGSAGSGSVIGSNTQYVISNVFIPVLTIPAEGKWTELKTILYSTNSAEQTIDELDIVKEIMPANTKSGGIEVVTTDNALDKLHEIKADLLVLAQENGPENDALPPESMGRIRIPFLSFPKLPMPTAFKGDR